MIQNLFTSNPPNKAQLILMPAGDARPNVQIISTLRYANTQALRNVLEKLVSKMDAHKQTLILYKKQVEAKDLDLVLKFKFKEFGKDTINLIRQPGDYSEEPFDLEYLYMDANETLHSTVNGSKANRFAVRNMYGERLSIHEDEDATKSLFRRG